MRTGNIPGKPFQNWVGPGAPGPNNDATQGYEEGCFWFDTQAGKVYACVSPAPGAAVWKPLARTEDIVASSGVTQSTLDAALLTKADASALTAGLAGKSNTGHIHAESEITNLVADLAAKAPASRAVTAGTGLTGGGDLSVDRSLAVVYGTAAGTSAQGSDARLSDARTPTLHKSTHQHGGTDEVGTSTPTPNALPKANASGLLAAGWIPPDGYHNAVLVPVGLHPGTLTGVTAFVSGSMYLAYLGRVASAITTADVIYKVTTLAAGVTWAEVALFKGSPVGNGNASLTRLGFTSVAAIITSTGTKKTTVALSSVLPGDDLWAAFGWQATTMGVLRGMLADDLQQGVFQSAVVRPSLAASPQATTLAAATLVPPWCAVKV